MPDRKVIYPYRRIQSDGGKSGQYAAVHPARMPGHAPRQTLLTALSIESIIYLVLGLVLIRSSILDGLRPFGIAYLAAIGSTYRTLLWPMAGGMVLFSSLFLQQVPGPGIPEILLLGIAIYLYPASLRRRWKTVPAMVLVIGTGAKMFEWWLRGYSLPGVLAGLFEVFMSAGLTLAMMEVASLPKTSRWSRSLSAVEKVSLVILLVGVLAGFEGLNLGGLTAVGLFSRLAVLVAAAAGGSGPGAVVGAVAGVTPAVLGAPLPALAGIYPLAGVLAGSMRFFGKFGAIAGMLMGQVLFSVYFEHFATLQTDLLESLVASGILLVIPGGWLAKWREAIGGTAASLPVKEKSQGFRELAAGRVEELGHLFDELSRAFKLEPGDSAKDSQPALSNLLQDLVDQVCSTCSLRPVCWERCLYTTSRRVLGLMSLIASKGSVKAEDVPIEISRRCNRTGELAVTINWLYDRYRLENEWNHRLGEARQLVAAQLKEVAVIIRDLVSEFNFDTGWHEDLETVAINDLRRSGIAVKTLSVLRTAGGRLEISIRKPSCEGRRDCAEEVAKVFSRLADQHLMVKFDKCALESGEPECAFSLRPAPAYSVVVEVAQAAKHANEVCGDHHFALQVAGGKYVIMLSDGMGSGDSAAQESEATVSLLSRLLAAGFNRSLAVRTVNSLLAVRSLKETFATVDLAIVDLYTGRAEFTKIGAPPSYILRGQQVINLAAHSLPLGILQQVEGETLSQTMEEGDLLVMITDGVLEAGREVPDGETWLVAALDAMAGEHPLDIAKKLLAQAVARSRQGPGDDMSVLVARFDARPS